MVDLEIAEDIPVETEAKKWTGESDNGKAQEASDNDEKSQGDPGKQGESTGTSKSADGNSQRQGQECEQEGDQQGQAGEGENQKENALEPGDKIYASIKTSVKDDKTGKSERVEITDIFEIMSNDGKTVTLEKVSNRKEYKTSPGAINLLDLKKKLEEIEKNKIFQKNKFSFDKLETKDKLAKIIKAGINNIWMHGPAGCGKTVMSLELANEMGIPHHVISCGIGTSATEFLGYKYPSREKTEFGEFYAKPSIIVVDEFTALDPSVAQVLNAALANGQIITTTGIVKRHPECIIIATSNTKGDGASRQYVANNQLDASTMDRFVGAVLEVDYSQKYESQFDAEVVDYVNHLRKIIKDNAIRRIASTRMIKAGVALKAVFCEDWKSHLISTWSDSELKIASKYFEDLAASKVGGGKKDSLLKSAEVTEIKIDSPFWN